MEEFETKESNPLCRVVFPEFDFQRKSTKIFVAVDEKINFALVAVVKIVEVKTVCGEFPCHDTLVDGTVLYAPCRTLWH